MKRLLILMLSLTFILVGCSESAVKKTADKFLYENKNLSLTDNNYVTDLISKQYDDKKDNFLNELFHSLGIKDADISLKEIEGYNVLSEKITELKSYTKYEINSVKLNDDNSKATVDLNIEYVDIGKLAIKDISEALDRNILKVYNGDKIDEKEFLTMTVESLNNTLKNVDVKEMSIEKNAKVNLTKKDKEWIINKIDKKTLNAFSLNLVNEKELTLNSKLKEVEENRLFLEIESNLKSSFNKVKELIEAGEITYDNLSKDNKVVDALSKFNLKSKVVKEVGNESEVYYVTKNPGEDEITMTVINGDEKFTFTEE